MEQAEKIWMDGEVVDHVSLRPADLMNASRAAGPSAPATAPTPNPPPSPAQNSLAQ